MKTPILLLISIVFSSLLVCSCKDTKENIELQAPLFDNLGDHKLTITTSSKLAQQFFNQGLNLSYGFNHAESARSFREAIRLDPECAMCHWGLAVVLGSNINAAMESSAVAEAYESAQKAVELSSKANNWEKGMIQALAKRYVPKDIGDGAEQKQQYADAMKKVYEEYPQNDDVATFTAEALMNLHPWDLWLRDGSPQPWTPEIEEILKKVIERNPKHPGANHFYIHVVEASHQPERANSSADLLTDLMPGAGHLVHMPSHIYIRTGRYHEGTIANQKAVVADSLYITACNAQGLYPLAYYPHNYHFLAATAALEGRGEISVNAAYQVAANVDNSLMREPGYGTLQHYKMIPHYVLVKFAQWDNILSLPLPEQDLIYPKGVGHYAKGMALAGKGDLISAIKELEELQKIAAMPELKEITIWDINSSDHLMQIASNVLEADILTRTEKYGEAIKLLKEAVAIEDQLNYNEPPDWFFSVRHTLGDVLIEAKAFAEAEAIYQEDLLYYPNNGFALNGLHAALMAQNKMEEAEKVKKQLDEAWKWSDIHLSNSKVDEAKVKTFALNVSRNTFGGQLPEGLAVVMCTPKGNVAYQ